MGINELLAKVRTWESALPEERQQYASKPPPPPEPPEDYATSLRRSVGAGLAGIGIDPGTVLGSDQPAARPNLGDIGAQLAPLEQQDRTNDTFFRMEGARPAPSAPSSRSFLGSLSDVGSDLGSVIGNASPTGMLENLRNPTAALADVRDAVGEVSKFGSQYVGKPAIGILGSALEPGMRADPQTGEHSNIIEQLSHPIDYLKGVGAGILHPQRAADEMDVRSQDYSGAGDTLAAIAEQPLSYAGGLGTPLARTGVYQALGGAGATEGARRAGLPEEWQQAAGIAGSLAGGYAGAKFTPSEIASKLPGAKQGFGSVIEDVSDGMPPIEKPTDIGGAGAVSSPAPPAAGPPMSADFAASVPPLDANPDAILGLIKPTPTPMTKTQMLMNQVRDLLGVPQSNDIAQTAINYRKDAMRVAADQGNALSTQVDSTIRKAFDLGKDGRVETLPGRPFIQDVAARLPDWAPNLTAAQLDALEQVRQKLAPFKAVLDRAGITPGSREDVVDGGFYMPRGRADLEGADAPIKVGSGRGGGKAGFEKHAKFESMMQGADNGFEYAPLAEAVNSYGKMAVQRAADTHVADYFKQARNEAGQLIGETPADRMNPVIKAQWEDATNRLASLRAKLATAEKRAGLARGQYDELDKAIEQVVNATPDNVGTLAKFPGVEQGVRDAAGKLTTEKYGNPQPGVRIKMPVSAEDTAAAATMNSVADKFAAVVPDDIERIGSLEGALRRTSRRIDTLLRRGEMHADTANSLRSELDAVTQEVDDLRPDYKRAIEDARATPRDASTITLPHSAALNGWTFPDEVASAMQSALNKEKPLMGKNASPTNVTVAYNNLARGLKATGDISFTGIQGLIGAARDPIGYGKAMTQAFKSMADPQALGAYLNDMDAKYAAAGKMSIAEKVKYGLHIGGADTEYSIKTGLNKAIDSIGSGSIPGTGGLKLKPGTQGGLNPFRGANRSFGYFGDVMRNELSDLALENGARKGFDMTDPSNLRSAMEVANNATGWSRNTFGGDLGQLAMFAPRFFQSQLDYLATAAQTGTIGGAEARIGLARLLGTSVGLTMLANEATGRQIDYKDLLNPTSSNFMRFRVKGQDVSLLGPWDSLIRSVVALRPIELDRDLLQGHVEGRMPDPLYFARTKASPAVGMAWDLLSGKTFTGEDARTPGNIATQMVVPFAMQDVFNQSPIQTAVGATGLKTTPMTPREQLDSLSRARFNGVGYADLGKDDKNILAQEHPDVVQRYVEQSSSENQKYQEQRKTYIEQQKNDEADLLGGKLTPAEYKAGLDDRRNKLEGAGTFAFGDKPIDNPTNWSQRYSQILQSNTDTRTGRTDWTAVDAAIGNLSADDQAKIAESRGIGSTPLETLRKQISREYNALPIYRGYTPEQGHTIDQLITDSRAIAKKGRTQTPDDSQVLLAMHQAAKQSGIAETSKEYVAARRVVLGILEQDKARANYRKTHPEEALLNGQAKLTPQQIAAIKKRGGLQ